MLEKWLPTQWTKFGLSHIFLLPLSWCFGLLVIVRCWLYRIGWLKSMQLPVPVVVVGNINVGGTGKTPLVIYLVNALKARGFNPGVISRGFGANVDKVRVVTTNSNVSEVGDEPALIFQRTSCPVYVGRDRALVAQALLRDHADCDVIISDDGLQHYKLKRTVELVVIDGVVGFGNRTLLPAGPLREPVSRLKNVDMLVINGSWQRQEALMSMSTVANVDMHLRAGLFYRLDHKRQQADAKQFFGKTITAMAGIGNPSRFFEQLTNFGLQFKAKAYADHYQFSASDFHVIDTDVILMTEKDAVKCAAFDDGRIWVLPVEAEVDDALVTKLIDKIQD